MWLRKWQKIDRWIYIDKEEFWKNFKIRRVDLWLNKTEAYEKMWIFSQTYRRIMEWEKIDPWTYKKIKQFIDVTRIEK